MMPAFKGLLADADVTALLTFLMDLEDKEAAPRQAGNAPTVKNLDSIPEYVLNGYQSFLDKNGYPGIKPPWGTLNAVALDRKSVVKGKRVSVCVDFCLRRIFKIKKKHNGTT